MSKKFIIKPEEKIVVGIFKDKSNRYSLFDELFRHFNKKELEILVDLCRQKGYMLPDKPIRSIARCHEDDVWNEETGRKVAEAKLDMKRHARFIRQYDSLIVTLHKILRMLCELQDEHVDKFERINDDFDHHFRGKVD